ncbi:hypothetical protein N781_00625 [Pontibacillus halophilus JSM 076056 = DSM 19796]|uniref:Uncharacterized protein n=1 Tax=Pontibacillus halophilus JSM 076056 = DSM 19796 TaxID=1385510 RepID=A0A0A5GR62_9BACI|nr:hypothetical protein [Pontibacillus halophilus]KGX93743.1 hypothetical protein N781_00625 [Pontibacillus halophilus JSM 076056 = DSM 19796]
MRDKTKEIQRGQSITFRLPSDTPDHLIKQLQRLKEREKRNFSSTIAQFALKGVHESMARERETVTVPLPKQLTKEQRNWLKHEHSEALIGNILYQLLMDPMRAMSLLSSMNSSTLDIEEALQLQEAIQQNQWQTEPETRSLEPIQEERTPTDEIAVSDDLDLDQFNFEDLQEELHADLDSTEQDIDEDDPLGDFLSSMNK